ncbi:MAG TPA: hypothetical protein VMU48_06025 [Terracidiphilus sp.]|nr:hypothetical protein [Terracidiphilus sp.]
MIKAMMVGCCTTMLCVTVISTAAQEKTSEPTYRVRGIVKGRLELPRPIAPFKLGVTNEVLVQLHGYAVHAAFAQFDYLDLAGNLLTNGRETEVTVRRHPDGSTYVEVVPERVGKAEMQLEVLFADGGAQSATIEAEVTLPDKKPERFLVERGGGNRTVGTIYMDLSRGSNQINLGPTAVFSEQAGPVPIPAEDVQFKVISANAADPPIRMDPTTGRITALHIGHAIVQTTFKDLSDLTCVAVMEDGGYGGERTNCADLVPPGMAAPPTGMEIDGKKPPSKIRVAPQP